MSEATARQAAEGVEIEIILCIDDISRLLRGEGLDLRIGADALDPPGSGFEPVNVAPVRVTIRS